MGKSKDKKVEIFDIAEGKHIYCWADTEGWTFLSFRDNAITIGFSPTEQEELFQELQKISAHLVGCLSEIKRKKK